MALNAMVACRQTDLLHMDARGTLVRKFQAFHSHVSASREFFVCANFAELCSWEQN